MEKLVEMLRELAEEMAYEELMRDGYIRTYDDIYNPKVKGKYTATMQDVYNRYLGYLEQKFEEFI